MIRYGIDQREQHAANSETAAARQPGCRPAFVSAGRRCLCAAIPPRGTSSFPAADSWENFFELMGTLDVPDDFLLNRRDMPLKSESFSDICPRSPRNSDSAHRYPQQASCQGETQKGDRGSRPVSLRREFASTDWYSVKSLCVRQNPIRRPSERIRLKTKNARPFASPANTIAAAKYGSLPLACRSFNTGICSRPALAL